MPAETLKYGDGGLKVHLRNICNHVLRSATSPRQWKENPIVSIPKNASSKMTDFRVITLMSVAAKTFNRLLLNRLYPVLNERLRVYQAGFRKKRNCAEQIHVLRRILEGFHQRHLPLVISFVDFQKA